MKTFTMWLLWLCGGAKRMKESKIEERINEIKKQLEYIEERDKVCRTFGCKGEKEELLTDLEELENMEEE